MGGFENYLFQREHGWMISNKLTSEAHAPYIFSRSASEFPNGASIWHYWDGSDFVHDHMLEAARIDSSAPKSSNSIKMIAIVTLFCAIIICVTRFCYKRSR